MKALILAAFIITIGLASCSVTEPNERVYYPQDRGYNSVYSDPYYTPVYDNRYSTRRVYDYNTGRYYDVPVYSNSPVYSTPNRTYRRDSKRDNYRRDTYRRDNYQNTQPVTQQPRANQQTEKRLPDGTRISPDGTVTLPNGQVKRKQ